MADTDTQEKQTTDKSADDPKEKSAPAKVAPAMLGDDIKIFPDRRLPHLDKKDIKAYEAETRSGGRGFALVCSDHMVIRADVVHKYTNVITSALPKLAGAGVVFWQPEAKEKYVMVYENTLGKPLSSRSAGQNIGIKADLALSTVMVNLVDAISSLHDRGVVHGNICLSNIFDGGSPNYESAMLGECLCAPDGYAQPILYETIERAFASPVAKGEVAFSDDIYALGVVLALLVAPHDCTEGMSQEEILMHKLELGTFNLMTSRDRLPGQIIEMLRGMLDEDPNNRWTIWEVKETLEGRRVTGKQSGKSIPKSSRPIEFIKRKFFRPDVFAVHLPKEPSLVTQMVDNGDIYMWLNRSLQSKPYEERYERAVEQAKKNSSTSNFADRVSAFIAAAMAPGFPIFYKGMAFSPAGVGNLLADAIANRKDINPFLEILSGDLVSFWAQCKSSAGQVVVEDISKFETCRMYLLQKHVGFGIERCLYFLSPYLHCMSDKLLAYHVRSSSDLLRALEQLAQQGKNRPSWFVDRHILAFLYTHDKSVVESNSADFNATEKFRQVIAVLKTFAKIQARDKMGPLPNLSTWIGEHTEDMVNRFHDRQMRKKVKADLEKLKSKGDLTSMAQLFNNQEEMQNDMRLFVQAMKHYDVLRLESRRLALELETNKNFGVGSGQQVATLVSGLVATAVVLIYLVFAVYAG